MIAHARAAAIERVNLRISAIWIVIGLAVQTVVPARGEPGSGLGPTRTDFIVKFLRAAERSSWPGYRPDAEPFLIEFDQDGDGGISILVAATDVPKGFAPVPSLDTETRRVLWRTGTSQIADRSMKAKPGSPYPVYFKRYRIQDGKESDAALGVMLHELFHIHQDKTFAETAAADAVPYDDPESLASLYIEHTLLARALNDDLGWREPAMDFLALRNERRRLRPQTIAPEDFHERYEGTAAYFELSGAPRGQGEAVGRSRTILKLMRHLRDNHRSHRSRYYPSGAAMGMLLDRAEAPWKSPVAGGASLFALLSDALPMSTADRAARLKRVRASYRIAALSKGTADILNGETEQRRKSHADFMRLGRWTVTVTAPQGTAVTDHVCVDFPKANFEDGTEIADVEFCSVRIKEDLSLDFRQSAIMDSLHVYDRSLSSKRRTPTIKFPLATAAQITLDGSPWRPADVSRNFKSLTMSDGRSSLVIRSPGRIGVLGREITVAWEGR